MKKIKLTKGYETQVDTIDKDLIFFKWYAQVTRLNVYAARRIGKGPLIFLHRVIGQRLGINAPTIDHIDGDSLNNSRKNLRGASIAQNCRNYRNRKQKTKLIGIWKVGNRWRAAIRFNGKRIYAGYFDTAKIAAKERDKLAKQYFGEFAVLNF